MGQLVAATVRGVDASGGGTVLLDDGVELPFAAAALRGSGVRLLRLGQRVRARLADDGTRVVALTIATLPDEV